MAVFVTADRGQYHLHVTTSSPMTEPIAFTDSSERLAKTMDERDPLAWCRDLFHIPASRAHEDGRPSVYLVGNSLGCMPKAASEQVERELQDWRRLGVDAHMEARTPWYSYHEVLRDSAARLVGALPDEVVMMNSLTVNLHLMLASFYRPAGTRTKIVIEDAAFPSDSYAVQSQIVHHGLDPAEHLIRVLPRDGEHTLHTGDVCALIRDRRDEIALVLLPGVNYRTGQLFDMAAITSAAREAGARVGWDLAHAAGNVPMSLHDLEPDFAVWCTYKYLNAGPGSTAGCFVHERNARDTSLPRLAGWWGNDPATRFEMTPDFVPVPRADAWSLSNPSVLSMAPLKASLEIFERVGIEALRNKSVRLTAYLEYLLGDVGSPQITLITPTDPTARGCQLSIAVADGAQTLHETLCRSGVLVDFRRPNIIRAAPVPLYNSFHDVWTFVQVLRGHVAR